MRILIPTIDYPPIEGGISTVALQLSRELAALGHEVTVVAPHFPGMEAFDANEPVRVVRFHGYHMGWSRIVPFWRTCSHLVDDADCILAINIAYGGLFAQRMKRKRGTPYITFAYAYEFLKFAGVPIFGNALRRAYNNSDAAVAISSFTRDKLEAFGVAPDCMATILPGAPAAKPVDDATLDAVRRKYVLENRRVILSVGRLIPRKNHVALVRALPRIRERIPDASLVIVGRGPCVSECSRAATELGVRDEVLLPGYVDEHDLAALYQLCDVFALPAKESAGGQVEGFGLVCAEAAAYGKPSVAGNTGGLPDAVRHGDTGLLIDPEDESALADALLRLLEDPAYAQHLGQAAKRRVEEDLNWRKFTEQVLDRALAPPVPSPRGRGLG